MFETFTAWAEANGAARVSNIAFGKLVSAKGLAVVGKKRGARFYKGVALSPDAPSPLARASTGDADRWAGLD